MANHADPSQAPQRQPRFADVAAFGRFLRDHRQGRNISLQFIANDTKIPERYLSALERGDITQWPGGIYRRAMIRAYATAVGLNPAEMADEFAALLNEHVERPLERLAQAAPAPAASDQPTAWSPVGVMVAFVGAATAAAFAWYGLSIAKEMTHSVPPRVEPVRSSQIVGTTGTASTAPSLPPESLSTAPASPATEPPQPLAAAPPQSLPTALPQGLAAAPSQVLTTEPSPVVPAVPSQALPTETSQALVTEAPELQASGMPETAVAIESARADGVLHVTSEPAGAQVTVNGIRWGETPLTIRHLTPGEKQLRLTKDGYISAERTVQVPPTQDGLPQTLSVELEAGP